MKSIAFKLWAGMMALVSIVLILLWLFQIVFLNSFYTNIHINQIIKNSQEIIDATGYPESTEDLIAFETGMEELAYNNNLMAEFIDAGQNTIFTAGSITTGMQGRMPMMFNTARDEAYLKAMVGETVRISTTHPRFKSKYMVIGLPAGEKDNIRGVLVLSVPLAPVEDTADILKLQLVYITIILLAATLLLSYFLSRSFTRPITEISRVSMSMAAGDLSARIDSKQKDEIGRLAQTINLMGAELAKTDQLRKDIVANVSHEIRTPLSLIKGYAETIRDVSGDNREKRERQLGIIIEESDRLNSIVADILNLSQIQAGYANLSMQPIKMSDLFGRMIKRFEILSETTGIVITAKGIDNIKLVGDEARIEQVMYNLVNNAFNHSPAGSTISLSMIRNGERYRVEVADQGEGIEEEDLKYIWERFYKADKSGDRKRAGSGLGLSIVKGILEAHNAPFGVVSKPGEGTTFWFELGTAG
ncbi:MAG: HAMP domain-containing protein [Clostridiales bacterium]|nr:HAMP domain-containing protein [Clostridiales bacterium]